MHDTANCSNIGAVAGVAGASCWAALQARRAHAPLGEQQVTVDIAVIGAGIVGVTTALLLSRAGCSVALLEGARLGRGATGASTAKVTAQHGLIYDFLARRHGAEAAALYGASNRAALDWIRNEVQSASIGCDFEDADACLCAGDERGARELEAEAEAAADAGFDARLEQNPAIPAATRLALWFPAQAQFNPVKYLDGLSVELARRGVRIFESTRVQDVEQGGPCTVIANGGRVRAGRVVVATHLPILDRGGFFGRAFPYRHMCLAAPVPATAVPRGMFRTVDSPSRSFRTAPWGKDRRLLVAGGEAFPTGRADTLARLQSLELFVRQYLGATVITHRWGNQDYYSADRLPFIGPLLPGSRHILVATGFNAWGITTGTVAAFVLADEILGRSNAWANLYDSRRTGAKAGARVLLSRNLGIARDLVSERLRPAPPRSSDSLRPGEGAIVRIGNATAAAFRDHEGVLHALDARCTHMGCQVQWNNAECTWDCHCHGSRFAANGKVINGPAVRPLRAHSGNAG